MLAQSFKTAEELDICEEWKAALVKTLVLLETNKLIYVKIANDDYLILNSELPFTGHFNMNIWSSSHSCGTVACIGGTAEKVGNVYFGNQFGLPENLQDLFYPYNIHNREFNDITVEEAAQALRNYLTRGKANWDRVL